MTQRATQAQPATSTEHIRESTVTVAVPVQAPQKDTMLNLTTVGVYIGLIVGIIAIVTWINRHLADRRKEDRDWMTGKLDSKFDKLSDDMKETKADIKETQRRLHDIEQQRASDREKIIVLEKDMGHFKDSQNRMEKSLEKLGEDQKTYFTEMAKSIREIRDVNPKG